MSSAALSRPLAPAWSTRAATLSGRRRAGALRSGLCRAARGPRPSGVLERRRDGCPRRSSPSLDSLVCLKRKFVSQMRPGAGTGLGNGSGSMDYAGRRAEEEVGAAGRDIRDCQAKGSQHRGRGGGQGRARHQRLPGEGMQGAASTGTPLQPAGFRQSLVLRIRADTSFEHSLVSSNH